MRLYQRVGHHTGVSIGPIGLLLALPFIVMYLFAVLLGGVAMTIIHLLKGSSIMKKVAIVLVGLVLCALVGTSAVGASTTKATYEPFRGVDWFGSYGNTTRFNDCTLTAAGDLEQLWNSIAGKSPAIVNEAPLLTAYRALTDNDNNAGVDPPNLFSFWQNKSIDGFKLTGATSVGIDQQSIEAGTLANHGLIAEINLPTGQGPEGIDVPNLNVNTETFWKAGPWYLPKTADGLAILKSEPDALHAVAVIGYSPKYVWITSWGGVQAVTWGWWDTFAVAAWGLTATHGG